MIHHPKAAPETAHNLWTIARIQNTLAGKTLIRRFLLDLTHAPEDRVMEVFTAWRKVAAATEARGSDEPSTPQTSDVRHTPN